MDIKSLTVIIPCYNEAPTIKIVIDKIRQLKLHTKKEIIIVDDGSTDESHKIIKNYIGVKNITCIFHAKNLGKGAAIKSALAVANGEFVIIQDADLECNSNDIKRLVSHAEKNNSNVVFGSRNLGLSIASTLKNNRVYFHYYIGGFILTKITNFLFNQNLTDVTVVYKLIKRDLMTRLELSEDGFGICVEIVSKLGVLNEKITEIPISYNPRSFKEGKKLRTLDGFKSFAVILRVFTENIKLKNSRLIQSKLQEN